MKVSLFSIKNGKIELLHNNITKKQAQKLLKHYNERNDGPFHTRREYFIKKN